MVAVLERTEYTHLNLLDEAGVKFPWTWRVSSPKLQKRGRILRGIARQAATYFRSTFRICGYSV